MKKIIPSKLMLVISILLLPVFIFIHVIDRFILAFCWWMPVKGVVDWTKDDRLMAFSVVRVVLVFALYGMFKFIFS